ncbi:MAG: BrnA antitoxin family protein [Symploca sp. SIO2D2]|nr:BrnA antitoxin family protein [Symploca sp. SIO2D2]
MAIVRKEVDLNNLPKMTEEEKQRFDAIQDKDIDYSDIPELDNRFFKEAMLASEFEKGKTRVTMRLDNDVLAWLKSKGRGYQTRANMILLAAMQHSDSQ